MHRVDHENSVLAAIDEIQDSFGGVAPPHLDVGFQREEHVGKQSLVNVRPFELGYPEWWSGWSRTEHRSLVWLAVFRIFCF